MATGAVNRARHDPHDVEVGENAHVIRRIIGELSVINADAEVGPPARRVRAPCSVHTVIGTFVETNASVTSEGVPHLTYCGDAFIGEGAQCGAGTIFANYDGDPQIAYSSG